MAIQKITFSDKVLGVDSSEPEEKKLTHQNVNEIKNVIDNNADELQDVIDSPNPTLQEILTEDGSNVSGVTQGTTGAIGSSLTTGSEITGTTVIEANSETMAREVESFGIMTKDSSNSSETRIDLTSGSSLTNEIKSTVNASEAFGTEIVGSNAALKSTINFEGATNNTSVDINTTGSAGTRDVSVNVASDWVDFRGVEYAGDYSTNFTNRSLVDKEYVDNKPVAAAGIDDVLAEGQLITANRLIDSGSNANNITIGSGTFSTQRCEARVSPNSFLAYANDFTGAIINSFVNVTLNFAILELSKPSGLGRCEIRENQAKLLASSGAGSYTFEIGVNGAIIDDNVNSRGIECAADYSANYNNRSYVDKEYSNKGQLRVVTVGTLPTGNTGEQIFVSDETGGAVVAFFDGANWRRCTDRQIVS